MWLGRQVRGDSGTEGARTGRVVGLGLSLPLAEFQWASVLVQL